MAAAAIANRVTAAATSQAAAADPTMVLVQAPSSEPFVYHFFFSMPT